jgi:hypothetical protein
MELLPSLEGFNVTPNVTTVYQKISHQLTDGQALLAEEEVDILRVKIAADDLEEMVDELDGLRRSGVPAEWFEQVVRAVEEMLRKLCGLARSVLHDDECVPVSDKQPQVANKAPWLQQSHSSEEAECGL